VDLTYDLTHSGYAETITLASKDASPPVFLLSSSDLSFRLEETGEVSILSADEVVGIIPPPVATDAAYDPDRGKGVEGSASYALTDLRGGGWELATTVDPAFLSTAIYPVKVDPPAVTLNPSRDTYADEQYPTSSYETSQSLRLGHYVSSYRRHSYMTFGLSTYKKTDRVVQVAVISAWPTYEANSSVKVNARKLTDAMPDPLNWNNKPGVGNTEGRVPQETMEPAAHGPPRLGTIL
jgi:hypothetical protein